MITEKKYHVSRSHLTFPKSLKGFARFYGKNSSHLNDKSSPYIYIYIYLSTSGFINGIKMCRYFIWIGWGNGEIRVGVYYVRS